MMVKALGCLGQLPGRLGLTELQAYCLVRLYADRLTHAELAADLGKDRTSVTKVVARARAALKRRGLPMPTPIGGPRPGPPRGDRSGGLGREMLG
jgi:predicted transcriptional regulator